MPTAGGIGYCAGDAAPRRPLLLPRARPERRDRPVEALIEALTAKACGCCRSSSLASRMPSPSARWRRVFGAAPPDVVINATGFAVSAPGADRQPTVLEVTEAPVLQVIFSGFVARRLGGLVARADGARSRHERGTAGSRWPHPFARRLVQGGGRLRPAGRGQHRRPRAARRPRRVIPRELAANWARLRSTPPADRRVAIVMANYPNRDGRLGNGVGLDTPAGTIEVLKAMAAAGYAIDDIPADGDALMRHLMDGPTNSVMTARSSAKRFP